MYLVTVSFLNTVSTMIDVGANTLHFHLPQRLKLWLSAREQPIVNRVQHEHDLSSVKRFQQRLSRNH